jgi:hypothetical protein
VLQTLERVIHMLNNNENEHEKPIKTTPDGLFDDCEKARRALQEWQERAETRQRQLQTQFFKAKLSKDVAA